MADVIEASQQTAVALVADPEIDRQIATARRFPRSIQGFIRKANEMVTLNPEVAKSCIYALPRKDREQGAKIIEGPSARFAEIIASAWGNMRAEGKVVGNDDQFVTARGVSWDVESNVAIGYEVRRRITNSRGQTYSADMIAVTGNAGASIALRNAILKNVPTAYWKPIYNACRHVIAGDAKTFGSRVDGALEELAIIGVPSERVYAALGIKGRADIATEHLIQLAGFVTAIRDGDTTIEEAFPVDHGAPVQAGQRKSQQAQPTEPTPAPATAAPATDGASTGERPAVLNVGTVKAVEDRPNGAAVVTLSTGLRAATNDPKVVEALKSLLVSGRTVELNTRAASDARFAPIVTGVEPLDEGGQQ